MIGRRKFLQLMGGIAALPALGKFASAPKKIAAAKKGIEAAGKSQVESILPDVIATVMKKGKEFDTGMPTSSTVGKEYKGVKVTESPDEIFVEFTTDNGNTAFASVKKADYVVDETTGKSVYKPPEYEEGQQVFKANGPDDYYKDVEFEILDSVNDLKKIATEDKAMMAPASRPRVKKSGGGAVGLPPVYQTNDPKEAIKEIIKRTPILGGTGELLPIYSNENMSVDAFVGPPNSPVDYGIGAITNRGDLFLDQYKGGDKGARFSFGTTSTPNTNFEIGYTEGQGPQFGLQYRRQFNSGGITSGPPPKKGPNSQGLATLFQTR